MNPLIIVIILSLSLIIIITYHYYINITYHLKCIYAHYSALSEEYESTHKASTFKVGNRVKIT